MSTYDRTILRLVFPQWQGGNNPPYYFGSKLLAWLAPAPSGPVEEVPVVQPNETPLPLEYGVVARSVLVGQARKARQLIDKHRPDRLVVLGGDCLVDLAPFAYLNERYGGELAVLWVDTHPDISTAEQLPNAHAMVLANLLGHSDEALAGEVKMPLKAKNVLYAGLHDPTPWEAQEMQRLGLKNIGPEELAKEGSKPVLDWLRSTGAKHIAIHFDIDVLDPAGFRAQLMANPKGIAPYLEGVALGRLGLEQVVALLNDVAEVADVVGLGIAEHLPWDAINLKNALARLPLLGGKEPGERR